MRPTSVFYLPGDEQNAARGSRPILCRSGWLTAIDLARGQGFHKIPVHCGG
jgi:hypothetical protein